MIITELGIDQVNHSETVTITRVVFSDLSLNYVINPAGLTSVTGGNTASVEPTIGLLYNGTINLQAANNSNFSAQSAFIFAKNDEEFLIAVSPVSNNRVSGELSISKIRKLSFNALASDLVLKPEVNSVVASAMAELPHPDFNSIVDSAASDINSAANAYTDNVIKTVNSGLASKADTSTVNDISNALNSKADKTALSDYATNQALTDVSSGITSELAKKADISVLSDKADVATVNDIKTALSGKASVADLSNYYTTSNASDSFKSVDNMLNTRARLSDFNALSNAQSSFTENMQGFTTFASSHIAFLQSKADTDAGNIINNNKLINGLRDGLDNRVKDNRDGSISFNGFNLSFRRVLDPHEDIFNLSPGVYKSLWGYQDSLKNYPSPNGAATVIVYGTDTATNNGMKIVVIDTWGGEYSARWNVTKFDSWQKSVDYSVFESALSNVKTDIANLTPTTSTVDKVDPSTVFRGYIEDVEFKLKDLDRPDGIYKVSTWISTKNCTDLPEGFYKDLGYTIQKTTIDDHTGIITVKGIKNMFQLTWLGLGTNWGGWIYSGIMG